MVKDKKKVKKAGRPEKKVENAKISRRKPRKLSEWNIWIKKKVPEIMSSQKVDSKTAYQLATKEWQQRKKEQGITPVETPKGLKQLEPKPEVTRPLKENGTVAPKIQPRPAVKPEVKEAKETLKTGIDVLRLRREQELALKYRQQKLNSVPNRPTSSISKKTLWIVAGLGVLAVGVWFWFRSRAKKKEQPVTQTQTSITQPVETVQQTTGAVNYHDYSTYPRGRS